MVVNPMPKRLIFLESNCFQLNTNRTMSFNFQFTYWIHFEWASHVEYLWTCICFPDDFSMLIQVVRQATLLPQWALYATSLKHFIVDVKVFFWIWREIFCKSKAPKSEDIISSWNRWRDFTSTFAGNSIFTFISFRYLGTAFQLALDTKRK